MVTVKGFHLIRRGVMKFSGSSGVRMEFFVVSGDLHFLYLDENRRLRCRKLISVESGEETSQDRSKLGFIFVPLQVIVQCEISSWTCNNNISYNLQIANVPYCHAHLGVIEIIRDTFWAVF
jgi:hypothetical protein